VEAWELTASTEEVLRSRENVWHDPPDVVVVVCRGRSGCDREVGNGKLKPQKDSTFSTCGHLTLADRRACFELELLGF